jgi:AmpE protein
MTFMIVLAGLLCERFFEFSAYRHWSLFFRYQTWLHIRYAATPPQILFLASVLPPVLILLYIDTALSNGLLSLLKLGLGLFVLIVCLGPQNFWADRFATVHANNVKTSCLDPQALQATFSMSECAIFGPVFWFILLGPAGALLYRLTQLSTRNSTELSTFSGQVLQIIDVLPVKMLTFLFALTGNFMPSFAVWKRHLRSTENNQLLFESGQAAIEPHLTPVDAIKAAVALIDRSLMLWMTVLAVVVLLCR